MSLVELMCAQVSNRYAGDKRESPARLCRKGDQHQYYRKKVSKRVSELAYILSGFALNLPGRVFPVPVHESFHAGPDVRLGNKARQRLE